MKTSQKSTSNPHDSSPLMFCESKSCVFIIIKFIFLKSSINIIAFSRENVVLSESVEKFAQIKYHLQAKIVLNSGLLWCFYQLFGLLFWCPIDLPFHVMPRIQ